MRTLKIAALVAVCLMLTTPAFAATRKYSGKLALSSFDCEKGPKSGSKYFTLESDSFLARFNLSPAQRGTVINFTPDSREEEDRSNFENSIIGRLFLGKKGSGVGTLVFRSIRPVAIQQTFDSEDCIKIFIEDNGKGMKKEVIDKIFDPFFTTKPIGAGTGLGLYITYDIIVNKIKGKIEVKSELEKFTEFAISIPISNT